MGGGVFTSCTLPVSPWPENLMLLSFLQVIKWIDEHGEPFLDKHTDVGMTAEKAEALLKRHEEFEAIAKVSELKLTSSNISGIRLFLHTSCFCRHTRHGLTNKFTLFSEYLHKR